MSFVFNCRNCNASLMAEDNWAGLETTCPYCHQPTYITPAAGHDVQTAPAYAAQTAPAYSAPGKYVEATPQSVGDKFQLQPGEKLYRKNYDGGNWKCYWRLTSDRLVMAYSSGWVVTYFLLLICFGVFAMIMWAFFPPRKILWTLRREEICRINATKKLFVYSVTLKGIYNEIYEIRVYKRDLDKIYAWWQGQI